MAYQADTSANTIGKLKQSVKNLKQPTIAYNREISKLLVRCCRLATEQYFQGIENSNYNGAIASLASYCSQLDRYEQIATFQTYRERSLFEPIIKKNSFRQAHSQDRFNFSWLYTSVVRKQHYCF